MSTKLLLILTIFVGFSFQSKSQTKNYVPDSNTAVKIAEAVWLPIYGEQIYSEKPYNAVLIGDSVWHVFGTLKPSHVSVNKFGDTTAITIVKGGVAEIIIRKSDSKILEVYHGK